MKQALIYRKLITDDLNTPQPISEVNISGFKHSSVLIMATSVVRGVSVMLRNLPKDVEDIKVFKSLFTLSGCNVSESGCDLYVNSSKMNSFVFDKELIKSVHGTVYLFPALLSRFGRTKIFPTGGCKLLSSGQERPIEHIIKTMKGFNVKFHKNDGCEMEAIWNNKHPAYIDTTTLMSKTPNHSSVYRSGITKTALILASTIEEKTTIKNPYYKLDVQDLIMFLKKIGCSIESNNNELSIVGSKVFKECSHYIASDSMEFVTFVAVSYIIKRNLCIKLHDVRSVLSDLSSEVEIFIKMGFKIYIENEYSVTIVPPKLVVSQDIVAHPDGVYSDSQPILAILNLFGDSPSKIVDLVWKGRFAYLNELKKIGVECTINENYALLKPFTVKEIGRQTQLIGSDLRSSAALLLFSLRYKELNVIDLGHLKRGYNCIADKLNNLRII